MLSFSKNSLELSNFTYNVTFSILFIYFEKERVCEQGRGKERGRKRIQAGSMLSAQSLMQGLNSCTVKSWPEIKPKVGHLTESPRCPTFFHFKLHYFIYGWWYYFSDYYFIEKASMIQGKSTQVKKLISILRPTA